MLEQTTFYPQSTKAQSTHTPFDSALHGSPDHPPQAKITNSSARGLTLFGTLLDAFNPLHHIPVFSTLYRYATDREVGILPRIASGVLLGGPIGAGAALVGSLIENTFKNDTDQHNSNQPHGANSQLASSAHKNISPWYLAGSPAAPDMGSAIKNPAPEYQDTHTQVITQLPGHNIFGHKIFPGQTQFPAISSHPHQRLNPETVSTIQAIIQTQPSATLHLAKRDTPLMEAESPSPQKTGHRQVFRNSGPYPY